MKTRARIHASLIMVLSLPAVAAAQNTLAPPTDAFDTNGNPRANMKSVNQLEPRTVIDSLPFFVTNSGAFYLTGNLTGVSGSNGITVLSSDVRLDLNRFALIGVPGSLHGIEVSNGLSNITIQNGVIRNWGQMAISAGGAIESEIKSITAKTNGYGLSSASITLGDTWLVDDCVVLDSSRNGLNLMNNCTVRETKVFRSGYHGILAINDCRIIGCSLSYNTKNGIYASDHCTISDCLVSRNKEHGIEVGKYCRVERNNIANNGSGGILGAGIMADWHGNRIEGNTVAMNLYGVQSLSAATRNLVIANNAFGNTTNFNVQLADRVGEVLMYGSLTTVFTNSNPWANFSF